MEAVASSGNQGFSSFNTSIGDTVVTSDLQSSDSGVDGTVDFVTHDKADLDRGPDLMSSTGLDSVNATLNYAETVTTVANSLGKPMISEQSNVCKVSLDILSSYSVL